MTPAKPTQYFQLLVRKSLNNEERIENKHVPLNEWLYCFLKIPFYEFFLIEEEHSGLRFKYVRFS